MADSLTLGQDKANPSSRETPSFLNECNRLPSGRGGDELRRSGGGKGAGKKREHRRREALQLGAPVERALLQSLASGVGRGQTRPRANLPKSGHAGEGGAWRMALRSQLQSGRHRPPGRTLGPGCSPSVTASPSSHVPAHTSPGSSGPSLETSSTPWPPG